MKKVVLCFDFREPLKKMATVDKIVWPDIDFLEGPINGGINFFAALSTESQPEKWAACDAFFSYVPSLWIQKKPSTMFCINAYCVTIKDFLRIQKKYGGYFYAGDWRSNKSIGFLIKSGWRSLGFDICSASLNTSLIYTTEEMNFAKRHMKMWNNYGLIKKIDYCRKLMKSSEFNPHDPTTFIPVEIYTNYFSPVKNKRGGDCIKEEGMRLRRL